MKSNHYEVVFKLRRLDGFVAYHFLKHTHRWWNGRVEWRDGNAYFLGGHMEAGRSIPFFDSETGKICGFNNEVIPISSMEFDAPFF